MATTKKLIGKVPVYRGQFVESKVYYMYNIVTYLGSSFICLEDNVTNFPCSIQNDKFIVDNKWSFFSDSSNSYLLPLKDVDISQTEFDDIPEEELDITKTYYIYE